MKKKSLILFFLLFSYKALAFPAIQNLNKRNPVLWEIVGAYPPGEGRSISTTSAPPSPSKRTFSQFGGYWFDNSSPSFEAYKNNVENKNLVHWLDFLKYRSTTTAHPVCGASPQTNTMNCFNLGKNGQFMASLPIPGAISSTPLFYQDNWLIGTTKGFLVKVTTDGEHNYLPILSGENINYWGFNSRKMMALYRPKTVYVGDDTNKVTTNQMPDHVEWIYTSSSELVGTPIIKDGVIYILSINQYLQAIDWQTGKLIWAVRLAPDVTLHLDSNALVNTPEEVVVGNSFGTLLILSPASGSILWTWQIPEATDAQRLQTKIPAGPDRYSAIVAKPLIVDRNVIASNFESMTQSINLDSHALNWSFPVGSVAQPRLYKDNAILAGSNGWIMSIDVKTGMLKWNTDINSAVPIVSIYVAAHDIIYAATSRGQVFALDAKTGKVLAANLPTGNVVGEFFAGDKDGNSVCLSFNAHGFRCYQVKI